MVTVGMNYDVNDGKEPAFEKHFALVVEAMSAMSGHVRTQLFRRVGSGASYLVLSEWSDREAFDAFVSSEKFRKVAAWGMSGILARRPSHEVYGDARDLEAPRCPAHVAPASTAAAE